MELTALYFLMTTAYLTGRAAGVRRAEQLIAKQAELCDETTPLLGETDGAAKTAAVGIKQGARLGHCRSPKAKNLQCRSGDAGV